MEWGTYLFFAFWAGLMTLYVIFFLPETKGVPLEEMQVLWARHWFWGKFVRQDKVSNPSLLYPIHVVSNICSLPAIAAACLQYCLDSVIGLCNSI